MVGLLLYLCIGVLGLGWCYLYMC